MKPAIVLENVSKRYVVNRSRDVRDLFVRTSARDIEVDALTGINLLITAGSCMALIGSNGAGKSTLIKIIAGVLPPTSGSVLVNGTINPIVRLNAGLYPELTGRENVRLYLELLGVRSSEKAIERISTFSDLGAFIDYPVSTYSSGMSSRLTFSTIIHVDAGIYLFDESFAVGDAAFQKKCLAVLKHLKRKGKTLIIATHSLDIVRELCTDAVILDSGRAKFVGSPADAIETYAAGYRSRV
jgi:ABC-2 type transport system ATP-binding protein